MRGQLSLWLGRDSSEVKDSYAVVTTSSDVSRLRRRRVRSTQGKGEVKWVRVNMKIQELIQGEWVFTEKCRLSLEKPQLSV